ncbi:unnamed protein product [Rhizophagus irregularis]|nr:unnamed protein product [Rhizophagus irregularis]
MSSKWCAYFSETEPKEYSFLNFYKYRSKQVDFTFSFQKESYKLQMDLDNLEKDGSEESKKTSSLLKKKFKGHRSVTLSYATDIDEILCLSSIIYVKEDKPEYLKCSEQIWQDALPKPLIPSELPVSAQLNIMQYSRFLTDKKLLREKWCHNWTKWEHSMTEEEKNIFECVQLVSRNFFLNIPSDSIDNIMDEDTFVHKYCHSMLEEIFNTSNLKLVWANGESDSSKERRKSDNHKHGRKPDFRVLFNKESEIIFGEIKPPRATNVIVNKALIKLAEFMKGSLDSLHKQFGYSQASETFGIIINGCCIKCFSMDIPFDGLYRFKQIGKMLLPTENANFLTITSVIENLYSLMKRVELSIDELNRPTTPTGLSYHRDSNTSPHLVHIPVLNIPPPVIID